MAFTLEQLRGFVAVADELHFGRAAARLKMTQPPLSRQIQKLERVVGAQLLDRDNRRVTLTAAGDVFLVEARRLLSMAESAPDVARRVSSGSTGVVASDSPRGRRSAPSASCSTSWPARSRTSTSIWPRWSPASRWPACSTRRSIWAWPAHRSTRRPSTPACCREAMLVAAPSAHRLLAEGPVEAADLGPRPVIMHSPTKARYFYDLVVGVVRRPRRTPCTP